MSTTTVYDALTRSTLGRDFENAFLQGTGLSIELIPSGEPTEFFQIRRRTNPFCRLMAQFTGSCAACQKVHAELQQRIADSLAPQTICCFAGLAEFAVPVVVGGQ